MSGDDEDHERVEQRLDDWRRRLIDLSHRNRLIAFKATKATTLQVSAPSVHELLADPARAQPWDFYFPPPPEESVDADEASTTASEVDRFALRSAIHRGRRANEIEVTEANPARIARILDNLAKRSNTEFQDKALRILYIGAGFLDWHDHHRAKDISSPLVLVPVELRRDSTRHPYRLYFVPDEDIVINPSLTEKLRRDSGLSVPEDWAWEDKPISQELDEIRRAVAANRWQVRDDAVIGLFSFQKYVMFRDLLDHADYVTRHPVIRALAGHERLEQERDAGSDVEPRDLDDVQAPDTTLSILDADASQRVCIEASKRGQSFVMQGPPGTGKSQTIANVIAEGIGKGKRVLFVSEKAAALDVVHKRLTASGLDEYCLMLHGERAGRREVVQALDRSLTSALQPHHGMRGDELERLGNLRTLLNDTAELIHAEQPLLGGRSLREVHQQLAALHAAPSIAGAPAIDSLEGRAVLDEYQGLAEIFQQLAERWSVSPLGFAWRGYAGTRFTADDHGRVLALLAALRRSRDALARSAAAVAAQLDFSAPMSLAEAERLADVLAHLEHAPPIDPLWINVDPAVLYSTVEQARDAYERAADAAREYVEHFPARELNDFSPEVVNQVSAARDDVRRSSGWTRAWDTELSRLPDATAALTQLPSLLATVRERAAGCASRVGQPLHGLTEARLGELSELADLAFSADQRPEPTWLVRAGLDRARDTLADVEGDLAAYQAQRASLLEHYAPEVLELDADALATRFREQYTSFFARLSGAYRADAKAIKAVRKDRKLPRDAVDELGRIAEARRFGGRLDAAEERMRRAFEGRSHGRDTDPAAIRAGLAVAERVLALSDPGANLDQVSAAIGVGSPPDPASAQAAARLRDAVRAVVAAVGTVQPFVEFPDDLFSGSLDELEARLADLRPGIETLAAMIADIDKGATRRADGLGVTVERAEAATQAHRTAQSVDDGEALWRQVIGPRFSGSATTWTEPSAAADWLLGLGGLGIQITDRIAERLTASERRWPTSSAELRSTAEHARSAGDDVAALFEAPRAEEITHLHADAAFDEVSAHIAGLEDAVDELHDWTQWRAWRSRAREGGWDAMVEALVTAGVAADDVVPAFSRAYWNRRLEAFYDDDPELADDLRGGAFGRWVDEFRALDLRLVATGADRLITKRERERRNHVSTPGSEIDLLRREARKKARHLPVRKLLERMPTLLPELKPCLMMSPLTVSHFLSADHRFDMVVIDEASQVPPQDAVNCIYRGDQLVVAGDSKQLPPTPFFQTAELDELSPDEEDAETREDMESILDACEALLPQHPLMWHYRSRDEHLIAFSNRRIYNDDLVTFPSAESNSPRFGVGLTHVADGIYDRGRSATNRREAQVVAQRVVDRLRDGSGRSLGVIAFNSTQAAAISEELDLLRAQHPDLEPLFAGDRLDAVFVKHLEAVQGDERDVIVFSIGYGRDAKGSFTMNFGPLNKDGGQRRLNVAVTRAREQVEVVASVRSVDFTLSEAASSGARLLRDYIAYAETGGATIVPADDDDTEPEWQSPLEEQVGLAIESLGYHAEPQVGAGRFRIDIGVRSRARDGRYLLGIECDGHGYAATPTARDRERLRHEVLDGLGWGQIHRIWSLDWVRNRAAEIERLKAALAAAAERDALRADTFEPPVPAPAPTPPREPPRERVERVVPELAGSAAAAQLPWTRVYKRARLGTPTRYYEFHETVNRREQTDMLIELIDVEAPVNIDYAIRRLAEAWGLQRAGHRVTSAGRQAISQATRRGALKVRGEFLWKPDQVLTHVRIPDPSAPDERREIDEIPPEEIGMAMARLREESPGIDDEQLIVQVARVLGYDRVGGRIRTVLVERLHAQDDKS